MSITIGEYVKVTKDSIEACDVALHCIGRVGLVLGPRPRRSDQVEVAGIGFNTLAGGGTDSWYWTTVDLEHLPGFRVQSWDAGQQAIFLYPKGEWLRCRLKWAGCVSDQSADVMLLNPDGSDLISRTILVNELRVYPAEKDKPPKQRRKKRVPSNPEPDSGDASLPWGRKAW